MSVLGDALFPVALAFAVLDELDGSPGQLGLVLAAQRPRRPMRLATLAFPGAARQPAIIALAGSTAAIAAFEALAGIAVAIGFAQWETTLGRLIPGAALSRVTSLGALALADVRALPQESIAS